jgi:hypothetical protein
MSPTADFVLCANLKNPWTTLNMHLTLVSGFPCGNVGAFGGLAATLASWSHICSRTIQFVYVQHCSIAAITIPTPLQVLWPWYSSCSKSLTVIREVNDFIQTFVVPESPTRRIAPARTPCKQHLEFQRRNSGPFSGVEFCKQRSRFMAWPRGRWGNLRDGVDINICWLCARSGRASATLS